MRAKWASLRRETINQARDSCRDIAQHRALIISIGQTASVKKNLMQKMGAQRRRQVWRRPSGLPRRRRVNLTACKRREHRENVSCDSLRCLNLDFLRHDVSAGAFALDLA